MAQTPYSWIKLDKIEAEGDYITSYPLVIYFGQAKKRQEFIAMLKEAQKNGADIYADIKGTK